MEGNPQFSYSSLRNAIGNTAAILQRVLPNFPLNPALGTPGGFGTGMNNGNDISSRRAVGNQRDSLFDNRDNHRSWDDHRDRERNLHDDFSSRVDNRSSDGRSGDSNRGFFGGLLERDDDGRRERDDDYRRMLDMDRRRGSSGFSDDRGQDDQSFKRTEGLGGTQKWAEMDNLQQIHMQLQAQIQQQQQQLMQQMHQHQFQQQMLRQKEWNSATQQSNMPLFPDHDPSQPGSMRLSAFERPSCILEPPPPHYKMPPKKEKPAGCRTVFIGWLPDAMTQEILNEIFYVCGPIESIKIRETKSKTGKRFGHIRFVNKESVDQAVMFTSYRVIIGNGDDDSKVGRINVDYADSHQDQREYENEQRQKAREERHRKQQEIDKLNAIEEVPVVYSDRSAGEVLDKIKKHVDFECTLNTVVQWFERGECNRRHVSMFYAFLHSTHTHIKRLVKEKQEHQEIVERQRQEQLERARSIRSQCSVVAKVFEAAVKKRSWDHFTKAQRKLITQWRQQVEEEIKKSEELQIQNREEVGMELDEDVSGEEAGNTAMYQSQPGEVPTTDSQVDTEQKSEAQPDAKRARVDSESSTAEDSVEKQNEKLRMQVTALKTLAEKNAEMMWQVEGYKNETELVKQQYEAEIQLRDQSIAQLSHALQGLQQYLTNVHIKELKKPSVSVEVEVVVPEDTYQQEDATVKYEVEADTENNQSTAAEYSSDKKIQKDSEDNDKNADQNETMQGDKTDDKQTELINTPESSENKEGAEQQSREEESNVDKVEEDTSVKKKRRGPRGGRRVKKSVAAKAKESTEEKQEKNENLEDSQASQSSVTEDESQITTDKAGEDIPAATTFENGEKMEEEESGVGRLETGFEATDTKPSVLRLSNKELALVGILCSYLHFCPTGATLFEIYTFVQGQCPGVESSTIWKILNSLPNLFCQFLALDGNQKWKFCGFETVSE